MSARYNAPLRYPGGKQKLTPFVIEVLEKNDMVGGEYAEPYACGAGVALELLLTKQVRKIHLNDSALPIYAFWRSVLRETDALNAKIAPASMTVEESRKRQDIVRNPKGHILLEIGYSAFSPEPLQPLRRTVRWCNWRHQSKRKLEDGCALFPE